MYFSSFDHHTLIILLQTRTFSKQSINDGVTFKSTATAVILKLLDI